MKPSYDVERLGQVFTPDSVVQTMIALLENVNDGSKILEPSCGDGAFSKHFTNIVAIEFDSRHAPPYAMVGDFFEISESRFSNSMFDSIIGNPPFVRFQDIEPSTKSRLPIDRFDHRTNLYVFFIDRCLDLLRDGGELVFITPRDFLKATHAKRLNERLIHEGSFTHFEDLGDRVVFKGFSPNCAIFRWVKGLKNKPIQDGRIATLHGASIAFDDPTHRSPYTVGDLFTVRVGGVSGCDEAFEATHGEEGSFPFVFSKTRVTGETRSMFLCGDSGAPKGLVRNRDRLLKSGRSESTVYEWVRKPPFLSKPSILVNAKTRVEEPFYIFSDAFVDGSLLSLSPKDRAMEYTLESLCEALNAMDWNTLGFRCRNRFLFSQKSLKECVLPISFFEALKKDAKGLDF